MDHLIQSRETVGAIFLCSTLLSCLVGSEAAAEEKKWSLSDGQQDCPPRGADTPEGVWRAVGFAVR